MLGEDGNKDRRGRPNEDQEENQDDGDIIGRFNLFGREGTVAESWTSAEDIFSIYKEKREAVRGILKRKGEQGGPPTLSPES